MSPSEGQLRAALHEGEGDTVDAGALIEHASWVRRERRRRVYLVAGTVAAVAVIGVGVASFVGNGGNKTDSAEGAASHSVKSIAGNAPPATSRPSGGRSGASVSGGHVKHNAVPRRAPGECPAAAPRYLLPGGGGSGQFGASDPLFSHNVDTIVVCAYPAEASQRARRVELSTTQSAKLAESLESSPSSMTVPGRKCANVDTLGGTLDLMATDENGVASKPVLITLGCPRNTATNGTAVRYVAELPDRLIGLLSTVETRSPTR